ncbi:M48 family metalloprotease [Mucilaginibacter corticis]|uniref:M48 family metalloprotease n=1 Tax=Mucilaginibacter corticis TaxID=2597670 RepID=A0A556MTC7_9SPHI|nr:M56 family metallopeptidase [Mucilaginibacter corticis]TSJ43135.1 M48 family metalloprotease [Mucilaginibacter corticis]
MQNLLYNISQVLGITIIHSLWQGLIVFIALRLFMLIFPARSAVVKYWVSYAALTFTLGWFVVTLFKELDHYDWLSTTALKLPPLALPAVMQDVDAPANKLYFTISGYMPYLTMLYVVGLVFNTLRLTFAWNNIYRIRQNISDAGFAQTVKRLSATIHIKQTVKAAFSEWVDVPCVTGFIKPIILLPVTLTCYLTTEEIEAVLLHELAHIKRNDYLLNFIQQVIGILLFFNPFARLINKLINEERENCCDDMVVRVTGSPFIYAQALLKLEENKQTQWQLALAATGKKYELLNRIERIMKTKTHTVNIRPVLVTVLALTCAISSIAWLNPEIKNGKVIIKNAPAIRMVAAAITAPVAPAPVAPVPPVRHKKHISIKFLPDTERQAKLNDTTIKHKKYKIVIENDNGTKNEYNSVNDLPADEKSDFLKDANLDNMKVLFGDTSHFNKQMREFGEQMKKQQGEMAKHFNSLEWKKQQADMAKKSAEFARQFNSKKFRKQQKLMVEQSLALAKKFTTDAQWQKYIAEMAKSGADMAKFYDSPEFKKHSEDVDKSADDLGKIYDSAEGKKQLADLQKQAEEMSKYYQSPKFKKQIEDIQKSGEAMGKYFETEEGKKQLDAMAKYGEDMGEAMGKYYESGEGKKQLEAIQKQAVEMGKYYQSGEGQKQLVKMQKQALEIAKKAQKQIIEERSKNADKEKAVTDSTANTQKQ